MIGLSHGERVAARSGRVKGETSVSHPNGIQGTESISPDQGRGTESTSKGYLAPISITEFYLENIHKDTGRWKIPNIPVRACEVVRSLVPKGGESTTSERPQKWPQSC